MKKILFSFLIFAFPIFLFAADTINLAGTVSDLALKPVQGAIVSLTKANFSDTVDELGKFSILDIPTSTIASWEKKQTAPWIQGSQLTFFVPTETQPVSIEIYNLKGSRVSTLLNSVLPKGEHSVSLHNRQLSNISTSVLILVLKQGNKTARFRMINLGNRRFSIVAHPNNGHTSTAYAMSKGLVSFAIVDTLRVSKNDTVKFTMPLDTYIDTLISIILSIIPEVYIDKIDDYTDYYQMDPDYGGFPDDGRNYCGPTSTSNAIMWLSNNGYPDLSPHTSDPKKDQHDVIAVLGSEQYMDALTGVGPGGVCEGLKEYVNDKGYQYDSLFCQGWRPVANEFQTGIEKANLDWIKGGILRKNIVLINFGWYTYNASSDEYARSGGHWMTVVGYGHDGQDEDPLCLVVHDPATQSTFNNYRILEEITSGKITGSSGMPSDAIGMYKYPTSSNRYGILDAAVLLALP